MSGVTLKFIFVINFERKWMNIAIQYYNKISPGVILVGRKQDSDELDVYYTGSYEDLEKVRVLVNKSIVSCKQNIMKN